MTNIVQSSADRSEVGGGKRLFIEHGFSRAAFQELVQVNFSEAPLIADLGSRESSCAQTPVYSLSMHAEIPGRFFRS